MPAFSAKPGFTFHQDPPPEVKAFFQNKGLQPGFSWKDVWLQEHAFAFTVAKAMSIDVLTTIRDAVQKAIDEGQTLAQFRRDLEPTLQSLGWWGRHDVQDPQTGETVSARLGSPRRLRTIYRANLRVARSAGQYERAQRTKDALPFFLYGIGPSERHRPEHLSKEGLILPVDDPFWDEWLPPNGWGCKCRVRQISEAEAARRGVSKRPEVRRREFVNDRTGEVSNVPAGIDPGWNSNPGKHRQDNMDAFLRGKLESAPEPMAQVAIRDLVSSPRFEEFLHNQDGSFPVARLTEDAATALQASNRVVALSGSTVSKNLREHPELSLEDYRRLPWIGAEPSLIVQDGPRTMVMVRREGQLFMAAVKATQSGLGTFVTSFRRTNEADLKRLRSRGNVLLEK